MTDDLHSIDDSLNAFCKDTEAYLEGAADGPLLDLRFAAKDIFDVAGHVTGGGNPDWKATHGAATETAWAVQVLVDAGATMVGKTVTDELTRGIFGENAHYGTPANPRAPGRVPGGSSSGSASAVAGGLVDFALGSDTLGSVRVPASFCGLYGLRPTHGRVPLAGVLMQAPSYDTVGWFARDAEMFARVGAVLLPPHGGVTPRPDRLIVAQDAFELADRSVVAALQPIVEEITPLVDSSTTERLASTDLTQWTRQQLTLQSREAYATVEAWIDRVNPRFSFRVGGMYEAARRITDAEVEAARAERQAIASRMDDLLGAGTVVCLPTTPVVAPLLNEKLSTRREIQRGLFALVSIASTIGAPQISLPLAEVDGIPVGLSLMGPRGSDEMLIAFAREVVSKVED